MKYVYTFLLFGFVFSTEHSVNYCGAEMCQNTNAHTFCQFPPGSSHYCTGYINAPLTPDEKAKILARLNRRRSEAASGRLKNLPAAGNMLKLRWVTELSREAQLWADQCRPPTMPEQKDACRDLYSMSVGQCVASVVGEAPGLRVESLVDLWYMQSKSYQWNVTFYLKPYPDATFYGDFSQIMWAHSYMVGCGRSRFTVTTVAKEVESARPTLIELRIRYQEEIGPWHPLLTHRNTTAHVLLFHEIGLNETDDVFGVMSFEEHLVLNIVMEIENNELLNYQGRIDEFYLTKMAVIKTGVADSTVHYNSHQKRDINETNNQESKFSIDIANNTNTNLSAPHKIDIKYMSSRKASLIGRPKSYNIEELNSVPEQDFNDVREVPKEKVTDETDSYVDYDFTEIPEYNEVMVTTKPSILQLNNDTAGDIHSSTDESYQMEVLANKEDGISSIETSSSVSDQTIDRINDVNMSELAEAIAFVGINITNGLGNETSIDELLSDPETVRQLQAALDRMEATSSLKVRRDLSDIPNDDNENQKNVNDIEHETTPITESVEQEPTVKSNNHNDSDRGPMLNMVIKYMPYLQQYDNLLQSKQSERSVNSGCRFEAYLNVFVLISFLFV